jgi:nucleotide-binding universal stress UspA family protein
MPAAGELQISVPGTGTGDGGGPSLRRILVPVNLPEESAAALAVAAGMCVTPGGELHLLHVRIFDPPAPRCPGRWYPETADEAAAVLDGALLGAWGRGLRASTAVVDAPRGSVGATIAAQAAAWRADVIVLTRRPRLAISRLLLGSVPDQVMRKASCPVLTVRPRPR